MKFNANSYWTKFTNKMSRLLQKKTPERFGLIDMKKNKGRTSKLTLNT